MRFRIWLSRTIFESMLIVMSILLALGVREWQQSHGAHRLIERSLVSFQRELTQNKDYVDNMHTFHLGLQNLLSEIQVESHPDAPKELRNILNSFQSAVLLRTAWDTSVATGALSEMDYELVYALSLTYSNQERFMTLYNTGLINLLNSNVTADRAADLAYAALRYANEVTASEADLLPYYQQALELLEMHGVHADTPPAGEAKLDSRAAHR